MNKNFWGDPNEDDEPLPEWMRADTYQKNPNFRKPAKTLEQVAAEALKKPSISVENWEYKKDDID
jgi:hypothetical protein